MAVKGRNCALFLVLALFFLSSFITARKEDPELMTCKHQCRQQRQYGEREKQRCEKQCVEYIKEKQGREKGKQRGYEKEDEEMDTWSVNPRIDPHQERENPYVFNDDDFETLFQNQFGRDRILPKFTKLSNHLKGIENFRVDIFEAKPMTFMLPKHADADGFIFVANGKGTITLVTPNNRERFNIQRGHIMKISAGTTVYLINSDNDEKLVIVKLVQPVNNPGEAEAFFGAGGRNPESFFNAFSKDIVEALFKVRGEKLQGLFRKQDQGIIKKASKEQIRALSKESEEGHWPFGGGKGRSSNGPFNIFRQRPLQNNQFGKMIEVHSDDFRQLQDFHMIVSYANITQGGMHTLFYNTRATKIAVVVKGKGKFQMACPHIAGGERKQRREREEETTGVHYEKVTGDLTIGTVFIVPAGHPFVTMASMEDNLELICFEVNAEDNERIPLAGKRSVLKQLEREAMELSFDEKADVVEELLGKQEEEFFFEGPRRARRQEGGRSDQ